MATNNVAAGLLTLGQGLGQLGAVPEYKKRLEQMEREQALKEQQFELNSMALKTAKEQVFNAKVSNLGFEYTEIEKGATPDWFATKEEEINSLANGLGTKPENIKLRIKSAKTQFEQSKNLSIGHLQLYESAIDKLSPDIAGDLSRQVNDFKTAIQNAKNPEELKIVTAGNEKLVENLVNIGFKMRDKEEGKSAKTAAAEAKQLDVVRGEIDNFNEKFIKEEAVALSKARSLSRVLEIGDTNKAALGLATMYIAKLGGNVNPSDRDLAAVVPNPSLISGVKRLISEKVNNKPFTADAVQLRELGNTLISSLQDDIKEKAKNYAQLKKGLIPGIESEELEQRLLVGQGLFNEQRQTAEAPKASSDIQPSQKIDTQAVYNQAQAILQSPQATPEQKAKADAALKKLKQSGFKPSK